MVRATAVLVGSPQNSIMTVMTMLQHLHHLRAAAVVSVAAADNVIVKLSIMTTTDIFGLLWHFYN